MFVHEMYGFWDVLFFFFFFSRKPPFWDVLKNNFHEGGTVIETLSKIKHN